MANARKVALNALCDVRDGGAYSNITLNKYLNENDLSPSDRALATAIFYGVLDRTITLDYVLSNFINTPLKKVKPFVLECLRIALYQIMYLDKIPDSAAVNEAVKIIKNSKCKNLSGFVNGVLRNVLRVGTNLPNGNDNKSLSVKYSCPEWIVESFVNDYGIDNTIKLLEHSLKTPPVTLRVNTLKTNVEELLDTLHNDNILAQSSALDNAIDVIGGIDVSKCKAYKDGLFHVQDIASQTVVNILSPKSSERVLDVCAAPGGKTFTMAQYMYNKGEIIACDLYKQRVDLITKGAKRLGITNIKAIQNDAILINDKLGNFDVILCDVLCSGLGVIRRKPEIKYKDISEYQDITDIQLHILENSCLYLNENGRILYSTCTLRKCENEGVIKRFLDKYPQYELKYQRTFMPHIDGSDGFYCALLQKSR
ncbi:MAG: 16S rRNA (cytosine(967)-C(5))-methyltransferase RsmB [Clostridia bacterium]|nr:16S rRNA (cytosine(967)-C(5))-methyltransferase RsmB [Clostridia bacterium]